MIPGTMSKLSHRTIASATTIKVDTDVVFLTGTTIIQTINIPNPQFSTLIWLIPLNGSFALGTGNIIPGAVTMTLNQAISLIWNPVLKKWHNGAAT